MRKRWERAEVTCKRGMEEGGREEEGGGGREREDEEGGRERERASRFNFAYR